MKLSKGAQKKFKVEDRVTRPVWLDTKMCDDIELAKSPLKHGMVIQRSMHRDDEVIVRWDDGKVGRYLDHGLQSE